MNHTPDAAPKLQMLEISEDFAGQRIDNFLLNRLKGVPRSHVYRILRTGEVRVNGGRCQAHRKLCHGDVVRIPPLHLPAEKDSPVPETLIRARLANRVLFEDDDFLVLNKPAGMAVHGGSGLSYGLIEGLRRIRPECRSLELVHRLDRDTSGCLLVAKKRSTLRLLHGLFRSNHQVIKKVYVALLAGQWARKQLDVDAPLKKNLLQGGERFVKVSADGKPALTRFRRTRKFAGATLVEAELLTGRTHQIRVHAKSMGHPIIGDDRYGDENANQVFRKLGLTRLFLHAQTLSFPHPRTGQPFTATAPLEQELETFLKQLAS